MQPSIIFIILVVILKEILDSEILVNQLPVVPEEHGILGGDYSFAVLDYYFAHHVLLLGHGATGVDQYSKYGMIYLHCRI